MQLTRFAVFSALAALAAAAPRHRQTTISKATSSASVIFQDICWRVCWPQAPTCPTGWHASNKGSDDIPCWTCCQSPSFDASTPTASYASKANSDVDVNSEVIDICLRVCFPEAHTCDDGWHSKNLGDAYSPCWTCCKAYDAGAAIAAAAPAEVHSDPAHHASEFCSRACYFQQPQCPEGWNARKFDECWTCCLGSPDDDEGVAIAALTAVHSGPGQHPGQRASEFCSRACYFQQPQCPEGWNARKFDECWTCCLGSPDDDGIIAAAALVLMHAPPAQQQPEICWRICAPEAVQCPEGWTSKQQGPCWTCCADDSEGITAAALVPLQVVPAQQQQEICWRICAPEAVQCPEGWTSKQQGPCWTCCADNSEGITAAALVPLQVVNAQQQQEICWRICAPEDLTCPEGMTKKQFGSCWTCCRDAGQDGGLLRGTDL